MELKMCMSGFSACSHMSVAVVVIVRREKKKSPRAFSGHQRKLLQVMAVCVCVCVRLFLSIYCFLTHTNTNTHPLLWLNSPFFFTPAL